MTKKVNKTKNKWCKPRHAIVRGILRVIMYPIVKLKYGAKITKFKEGKGRNYLVMYNHQTPFDQFFVGLAMPMVTYYLATEDIFSNGFISSIIKYLVAPIPIKKMATDFRAVMNMKRVANEGVSIVLAPEGNRTYSGKTEYIKPSIAGLCKLLKMPIALFKIEGGYGVQPRWSDKTRKGKLYAGVTRVLEYEEYKDLTDDELNDIINKELYINDCEFKGEYKSNKKAEYIERMLYVCPNCGFSKFTSNKNEVSCNTCGLTVEYQENKTFKPIKNCEKFNFKTVNDWYEYQNNYVLNANLSNYLENPVFIDTTALYEVEVYKNKKLITKNANLALYGDRIECEFNGEKQIWYFSQISALSVLGRNKANVYVDGKIYQFKSHKRFNALKYVNFYWASKCDKGEENVRFLGL